MKFFSTLFSMLAFSCLGFFQVNAQVSDHFPGQLLVQFTPGTTPTEAIKSFDVAFPDGNLVADELLSNRMNIWLMKFNPGEVSDLDALLKVNGHISVINAQYNHTNVYLRAVPNDPDFDEQWSFLNDGTNGGSGLVDIDASSAWDITTGGTTAEGHTIVVAVVDGGADIDHEDIGFFKNTNEIPNNNIDDDNNGYVDDYDGWNAYNTSGNVGASSHGTHVFGTVGAKGDNGIGVTGVNWNVKVMPISGSSGNEATVIAAYGYVLEMRKTFNETNGAQGAYVVATNSSFGVDFGQPSNFPIWCAFYDSLGAAGVLSAAATANLAINIDNQGDVPTACGSDYMIAVTNSTSSDQLNNGAGFGVTTIDLAAPGTNIYSTRPNDNYGFSTGTSMATPHVAGTVGLMYSAMCQGVFNQYSSNQGGLALFVKDQILNNGVDVVPAFQNNTVSGGRLNLQKCVAAVSGGVCLNVAVDVVPTNCGTGCTGVITLSPQSGTPPYTYQWSHDNSIAFPTLNGLCAGTYTITVTDGANEQSIQTIDLVQADLPNTTFTFDSLVCPGSPFGTAAVDSAGYTYAWSTGSSMQQLTGLSGGTYTVTVSNQMECDTVFTFTIAEPPPWVVTDVIVPESGPNSNDASIDLTVSGAEPPYTFLWNDGGTTEDRTGLAGGSYFLMIRDNLECQFLKNIFILPTGVDELVDGNVVEIWPNPSQGQFSLNFLKPVDKNLQFRAWNPLGKMMEVQATGVPGGQLFQLDLASASAGVYLLEVLNGEQRSLHRILVN